MKNNKKVIIVTLLAFALFFFVNRFFMSPIYNWLTSFLYVEKITYFLAYSITGIPLFAATLFLHHRSEFFNSLGIKNGLVKGLLLSFAATLPMLLGYMVFFNFNNELSFGKILGGAVYAAFFEELYFRGFLFGQLFRYSRLGFVPSIIVGAIIFASLHLYQGGNPWTLVGIFLTTLMGAVWFAWLYAEWNNNLWLPIFLHLFMNFYWMLFSAGDNALGGLYSNIFRYTTVAITIIGTIVYKRKNGVKLAIGKNEWWMKKE